MTVGIATKIVAAQVRNVQAWLSNGATPMDRWKFGVGPRQDLDPESPCKYPRHKACWQRGLLAEDWHERGMLPRTELLHVALLE